MSGEEHLAYDSSILSTEVRTFFERLMSRHPLLREGASLRRRTDGGFDVWIELMSPTRDRARTLCVWSQGDDIGISFGAWHTHPELCNGAGSAGPIVAAGDLVAAILDDEIVLVHESGQVDGRVAEHTFAIDVRGPDALMDYQTDPYRLPSARMLSWTGSLDRDL